MRDSRETTEIVLVNKMEAAVRREVKRFFSNEGDKICSCSHCELDIVALALNSLPPKYVVTNIGNAVTNVNIGSSQWKADVTIAVSRAAKLVAKHPRHD